MIVNKRLVELTFFLVYFCWRIGTADFTAPTARLYWFHGILGIFHPPSHINNSAINKQVTRQLKLSLNLFRLFCLDNAVLSKLKFGI